MLIGNARIAHCNQHPAIRNQQSPSIVIVVMIIMEVVMIIVPVIVGMVVIATAADIPSGQGQTQQPSGNHRGTQEIEHGFSLAGSGVAKSVPAQGRPLLTLPLTNPPGISSASP